MSKINEHNYEAYYLDYLEGQLNAETAEALLQFLENHPDLKEGLEGFEIIEVNPDPEVKFDKDILKQHINKSNVEDYIIASIEDEIEPDDARELEEYLEKSEKGRKLEERYRKTILTKPAITFPEKNQLKKRNTTIYYLAPLSAAAAVVLIILAIHPRVTDRPYTHVLSQQEEQSEIQQPVPEDITPPTESGAEEKPALAASTNSHKEIEVIKETEEAPELSIPEINSVVAEEFIDQIAVQTDSLPTENQESAEIALHEVETIDSVNNIIEENNTLPIETIAMVETAENEKQLVAENKVVPEESIVKRRRINLWKIAELGVKGFSILNERNYAVEPHYTDAGDLESVTVITNKRRITSSAI